MDCIKKTVFITAGNRDLGYALVEAYLEKGYVVYTTFRRTQKSLALLNNKHPRLHVIQVDIKSPNSLKDLTSFLKDQQIDILIHNACKFGYRANKLEKLHSGDWQDAFYINTIFPIQLSALLRDNIKKSKEKKVVFITSRRGSNTVNLAESYQGRYAYRSSKAALNSAALAFSQDFLEDSIAVLMVHPGRVATELTRYDGMSPAESARHIIEQVDGLTLQGTGHFLSADDGKAVGW